MATEYTAGGEGIGGNNSKGPGPRCTSTVMGNKDQVLAEDAAVHSEWD